MLDDRKSVILQALVEEYIRTGEPVSSRAVLEASGLDVSSATIRNELARLEADGFVMQPHTSAGRIPTQTGFRYFVDHCAPIRLRRNTHHRIANFFSSVERELSHLLKQTSRLLADITHFPAVVIGPETSVEAVRGLHVVQVAPQAMLVVIVADSGRVLQELVRVPDAVTADEIADAEGALQRVLVGQALAESESVASDAAPGLAGPALFAYEAAVAAIGRAEEGTRDLFVGGAAQLAAVWEDLAKVHRLLAFLERESDLVEVLAAQHGGPTVLMGKDLPLRGLDVALVATSYDAGDNRTGSIGVFGPLRMDYRRTIKVVEEVGEGLAESLGG